MRDTANLANLANTQQTQGGGQTDTLSAKFWAEKATKPVAVLNWAV